MADIPDNPVLWGVENPVKGKGEFNHSETGGKMTAICGAGCDDQLTYFGGKLLELGKGESVEVSR
jgi:hypothetical protein